MELIDNQLKIELSPKQCEFINKANKRWNGKIGATQCGKTFLDVVFIIPDRLLERKDKPGLNVLFGVTQGTIERNILEPLRDLWGESLISEINGRNIATIFGQKVYCLGTEKVNQVSKIRGAKFKYVYIDELVDANEEVFNIIKSRMSLPYSVCDFTGNPSYPTHFVKEFIDSKADIYCQSWTIYDNPFLDKEYVKQLEIEYEGTVYFDRYIMGKWRMAEGSIYKRFVNSPQKYFIKSEDVPLQDIMEINIGVDFGGTSSGHAFVASGITYDYKELYGLASKKYMNADYGLDGIDTDKLCELAIEFVEFIQSKYGEVDYMYWDNENTVLGNSLKKIVQDKYPNIKVRPCVKAKIVDRIELLVKLLGAGRFYFTENCDTLKVALQEAVYDKKAKKDTRLDDGTSDIDTMDSFEYSFTSRNMNRFITG